LRDKPQPVLVGLQPDFIEEMARKQKEEEAKSTSANAPYLPAAADMGS
jgi:hypothetical protein